MRLILAILPLLLVAGCSRGEKKPVCIVTYTGVIETFPLDLAQDLGYFRDEGVQVNIEHGAKLAETLVGGSCDVAYDGYVSTLQVAAVGQQMKSFFIGTVRPTLSFVISPQKSEGIRKVEDLKGALVGISSFGGPPDAYVKHLLRQHNMAASDVTLIPTGVGPKSIAALEHGKVDAAWVGIRSNALLRRHSPGIRVLFDPRTPEGCKEYYGAAAIGGYGLYTKPAWLEQRPDDARRIARAMIRTNRWVREHSVEEVYARMQPQYRSDDKEVDIEALRLIIDVLSPDGRMPPGGAEAVQRVVSSADERVLKVDPASTYTNEFLETK